jgi:hypothetical protein
MVRFLLCEHFTLRPLLHGDGNLDQADPQERESSREFATFFMVSRYGSENLPFAMHHGIGGFCLARDEQRTRRPGLKH